MPESARERLHRLLFTGINRSRGRPLAACLRQLRAWEQLEPAAFRSLCAARLDQTLVHAKRTVPFYQSDGWREADPRNLCSWPVLERDQVQNRRDDLLSQPVGKHYYRATSGSTGKPVTVAVDGLAAAWAWANEYRGLGWHGIGVGARNLKLHQLREPAAANWIRNMAFVWTGDLSPEVLSQTLAYLRKARPRYVWGFVSAVAELARHAKETVPGPLVSYAKVFGEQLHPFQRTMIEEGLGARVIETYGCCETGTVAYECPLGSLHVFCEHVTVEVVNDGRPAAPGEMGEILLTCLTNPVMPLVRYRVGDRGRLLPEPCGCGRPHPVIADILGRSGDMLVTADGRRLHSALLGDVLKAVARKESAVGRIIFEQRDRQTWIILVEPGPGFDEDIAQFLSDSVRAIFGHECRVEVRRVSQIPREPSGKFRFYRIMPDAGMLAER